MKHLSARTIIKAAFFVYSLKLIGNAALGGASMACAEGGRCGMTLSEAAETLRFALPYAVGASIYLYLWYRRLSTSSLDSVVRTALLMHAGWLCALAVYGLLLAPIAPELLSYYDSPGARAVRFLDTLVVPVLLTATVIGMWPVRSRENKGVHRTGA
jgi:hypothetical protein